MKILFANNYYYLRGGSERVFFDEIKMLSNDGHTGIPYSRQHSKNIKSKWDIYYPPDMLYEHVNLIRKFSAGFQLIYSRQVYKSLNKLISTVKPDLLHAHNIYGRLTTAVVDACKKNKIPIVMTLHDYKLTCPSYLHLLDGEVCEKCNGLRYYNCLLNKCHKNSLSASMVYTFESYFNKVLKKYDYVSYFICPSEFIMTKHMENGIDSNKLVYIPNFIHPENYIPDYESNGYILYVGRLSKEKGLFTLLKAVEGLGVKLKIVGDGPMRNDFHKYVEEKELGSVEFEGYKTGDQLANIYQNASFVVFPSEWYENAPMTILESYAYGKPVIATSIGGTPEIIGENETGLLFSPGDHIKLREIIKYLSANPSVIKRLGNNARIEVEEKFNSKMHMQRLLNLYERVLS